jgi:hypothetical protein
VKAPSYQIRVEEGLTEKAGEILEELTGLELRCRPHWSLARGLDDPSAGGARGSMVGAG